MPFAPDWLAGDAHLRGKAPELNALIDKYGPCTLKPEPEERYFEILVRGIISQQLPPEVVNEIYLRLKSHLGSITPGQLLASDCEALSKLGLSTRKSSISKVFRRWYSTKK
jgi:DNA-3-methyladenine glycosylase II